MSRRNNLDIVLGEHGDARVDPVSISEAYPLFKRRQDVDQHIDPLLFNSVRTGANYNRIDTEDIGHDFEVAGIADFQERLARLDRRLALLHDLQHHTGHRCRDVPAFDRRVRTI